MRARIGITMGTHWGGIVQALDVIALISAIGAIGSLPALLSVLTKYTGIAAKWLGARKSRFATPFARQAWCNKG